jgi:glycosyltransferase involved in cell wall biosynthesis
VKVLTERCDVLFVAPRFHTNQAGLVRALTLGGYICRFIVERIGSTEDHRTLIPQVIRQKKFFGLLVPPIFDLANALISLSPRLVVIRNPHHPYGLVVFLIAMAMRRKILLYTQHPFFSTHRVLTRGVKRFMALIGGATWITPCLGNRAVGLPISKSKYVPFCIVDSVGAQSSRPSSSVKRLLAVGKMTDRKQHIELVRALAQLPNREWRLTIVGESSTPSHDHYLDRLRLAVRESGCEKKIVIRINVPAEKMLEYYDDNDVMILASRDERASVTILEAMAAGLFVVSGKGNGTACYIIQGVTGFVFSETSEREMREMLSMVFAVPGRQIRRGGALGKRYAAMFHGVAPTIIRFGKYVKPRSVRDHAKRVDIPGFNCDSDLFRNEMRG